MKQRSFSFQLAVLSALVIGVVVLSGCGLSDPTTQKKGGPEVALATKASPANDVGAALGADEQELSHSQPCERSQTSAARVAAITFTRRYTNWNYKNFKAIGQSLLPLSDGDLRETIRIRAEMADKDQTLERDKPSHLGRVLAADIKRGRGGGWSGFVVVRETALADGKAQSGDGLSVYSIALLKKSDRFVVTSFEVTL